jgi:preprotein translocase subunit SecA
MLNFVLRKIFGTKNERTIKSLFPLVARINELESEFIAKSDEDLKNYSNDLRLKVSNGAELESLQPEAFALVRETAKRTLGMRHFDVQLIGGAVLHSGRIAEMKTGEGKTLVATLPAYLNALSGHGVHIVTVNDYLAKRDAEWMGTIFRFLNLSVGVVHHEVSEEERRHAYAADITYGQNNEFGFDFLRDNMKFSLEDLAQRGHHFAIVDEVDSILIDEARTPLIISGPAEQSTDLYYKIDSIIPHLNKDSDFEVDLKSKSPTLTDVGVEKVESLLNIENLYDPNNNSILHHTHQALRAHVTMTRDVDYVVKGGKILIVDEFTGRLMPGRRWSKGLHQAVEAKEKVKVQRESQTLASITFQNYFRMYKKLAGMTGTADTEAVEFSKIYSLDVVVIPTNKPLLRQDLNDLVFRSRQDKYDAVVEEIEKISRTGQPVLVGTISIDQSEYLSEALKNKNIEHKVLNAKQHKKEAEIVAQAGRLNSVTIATNMAGRGTDIVLGGNPEFLAFAEAGSRDLESPEVQSVLEKYRVICEAEKQKVLELGGLYIIGTERHESRRIDNQLRGRAGRQGDPGATRFFVSLEDDLMMRFGGERVKELLTRFGWKEGMAIESSMVSSRIEEAQKRVESMHFDSRKYVTEYDDVMNKQRQVIYDHRLKIFSGENIAEEISFMIADVAEELVNLVCQDSLRPTDWDLNQLKGAYNFVTNHELPLIEDIELSQQALFDLLKDQLSNLYTRIRSENEEKIKKIEELFQKEEGDESTQLLRVSVDDLGSIGDFEQRILLETLDASWNRHLQEMDDLKEGIGLRGYGQKNPLYEYQQEAFRLFTSMLSEYKHNSVRKLFMVEIMDANQLLESIKAELQRRRRIEEQLDSISVGDNDEKIELEQDQNIEKGEVSKTNKAVISKKGKKKLK